MEDFTNLTSDYSKNPADYCKYPVMVFKQDHPYDFHSEHRSSHKNEWNNANSGEYKRMWQKPEVEEVKAGRKRRKVSSPSKAFTHLVASPHESHSAQQLCESETSHGPDFVSHKEGVFCDMETRALWPLCNSNGVDDACYHWDTHSLVNGMERAARNYSHVEEWD